MISIIGVGRVGSTAAFLIAMMKLDDIMLIDIIENLPQGHALDMNHAMSILDIDVVIEGSNDFASMEGSELVIVTAGYPRKPGMSREELVGKNAGIVVDIAGKIKKYAPDSIVLMTTNPLDPMAYLMYKKTGFQRNRVIGFSGVLDAGRLKYYASKKLGIGYSSIIPVVLGQHGKNMYPVPRLSTVMGKSLSQLLSKADIEEIVKETIDAGAVITRLRGFSSNFAPAAGLALMCEAILKDLRKVFLASVYLNGEYGVKGITASVPVIIGGNGVEKIIELDLNEEEKKGFIESINAVKKNIDEIPKGFI